MPLKDPEARRLYNQQYWQEHKAERRAYQQGWQERNREKQREANRRCYYAKREERIAKVTAYHKENPEIIRKANKNFRQKHPEVSVLFSAKRRAQLRNVAVNDFTTQQWLDMQWAYNYRCTYCGEKPDVITHDHVIPVSRGGDNTAANIVPACKRCNCIKHTNAPPPMTWMPVVTECP